MNNGKCKLRKKTKQNFIQIPFIQLIHYQKIIKNSLANEFKGTRAKRGLFKDIVLNKIWNADLNGAVNHIKVAFNSCFRWLKDALFKLCNPKIIKSANDFLIFNNRIVMQVKSGYQVPLKL